jgi:hypothetical protein
MLYRTPTTVNTGGGVISCEFWGWDADEPAPKTTGAGSFGLDSL